MLNKILFSTMIIPFVVNYPLLPTYNNLDLLKTHNNYDELTTLILDDISNYNENNKMFLDSSIVFKQHTLKELFVIGNIRANQKQWDQYTTHTFSYPVEFDFSKKIAYGKAYNSFQQIYKDPDPKWCDPAGARWNERQKNIVVDQKTLYGQVSEKHNWFGNEIQIQFSSPEITNIDDGHTLAYSPHSYLTHQIRMYSNGTYTKKPINQKFLTHEITNNKFVKSFLSKNEIPLTNKGMVWNSESIKLQPNIYGFNENLMIIKTLHLANETIKNLNKMILQNTNNGNWNNNSFSKRDVQLLIQKIENYQFNNFKQLIRINNKISQNQLEGIDGNFLPSINQLNDNLHENQLISKKYFINLQNVENFYKIIILFFKNNEIYFNFEINEQQKQVRVWDGSKFNNLLEQLQYDNFNYLNVSLKSININYIGDLNQTNSYNQNWIINTKDDFEISKKYNFEILYRYNALNINSNVAIVDSKKGVLINSNKFVSELVNTQPDNLNQLNLKNKTIILDNINQILNSQNPKYIQSNLIDISTNNKTQLIEKFSIDELKDKAKLLNIQFTDWFNFMPNNYDGVFYVILKIDNWKFVDKTNGDYTNNFKKQFYSTLNKNNINVVELKSANQTMSFDNAGYFLCRFRTNRVIFDYYDEKPIIDIENIELIKQQIRHFFEDNKNNWYMSTKTNKWSDFFFNYEIDDYDVVVFANKLNVDLEISSYKFRSPFENQQFQIDLKSNPILRFLDLNKKYEIVQQNEYCYLTSQGQTTLNLKVNLYEFLKWFYNPELANIENLVSKNIDTYKNNVNKETKIRKTLNWVPTAILISSFSLFVILLSILITFIKKKYKTINII